MSATLLPRDDPSSRALAAVIAILTFLAALAAAGAQSVATRSVDWRVKLTRQATLQILPRPGQDFGADAERAAALARATPGIAEVTALSRPEGERLLAPWLGTGLDLSDLPVPRLVTLRLSDGADLSGLAERLATDLPNARLDDHRRWVDRLAGAATGLVLAATAIVGLVLAAAALAAGFATRGALAGSRDVVEVLHLVGASEAFVAKTFATRFLRLGAAGAVAGTAAAAVAGLLLHALPVGGGGALTGSLAITPSGFAAMLLPAALVPAVTALASWFGVKRFLGSGVR